MLVDEWADAGRWLFRWRSYLPIILLPLLLVGLRSFQNAEGRHSFDLAWRGLCLGVSMLGLLVRIATVGFVAHGSSGRGTRSMQADTFNTTGMYSIVRHPLYLGNFLVALGILLYDGTWYTVAIGTLVYWLYYERIMLAEETLLAKTHGDVFRNWAAATPAFVPRISQWRPPSLGFSARTALRREYSTFFMIICVYTVIEVAGDYEVLHRFYFEPLWRDIFFFSTGLYVVTRLVAKTTRLLEAPGR